MTQLDQRNICHLSGSTIVNMRLLNVFTIMLIKIFMLVIYFNYIVQKIQTKAFHN